jgi:hypothetical protein
MKKEILEKLVAGIKETAVIEAGQRAPRLIYEIIPPEIKNVRAAPDAMHME